MRTPSHNQMPFCMPKHYRHARVALRTPLLSIGQPSHVRFTTWETTSAYRDTHSALRKRERVLVNLTRRWESIDLVSIGDAPIFHYAVSQFMHASDRAYGCAVSSLRLPLDNILVDLEQTSTTEREVIDALRRITNTVAAVSRRSRPRHPPAPLITITPHKARNFDLTLSTWLEDEIMAGEVCQAPLSSCRLGGIRQRLYGWMIAWVGREQAGGRVIRLSEVLDRLGPLWVGAGDPWDEVCTVVEANDLPDFHFELTTYCGDPAIFVRPRRARQNQELGSPPVPHLNEIDLGGDWASEAAETSPLPREISL